MIKKIEYGNLGCFVSTTEKTVIDTGGLDLDPHVIEYAAWRWLYHCRTLYRPLCLLTLSFRQGRTRRKPFVCSSPSPRRPPACRGRAGAPDAGDLLRGVHLLGALLRPGTARRYVPAYPPRGVPLTPRPRLSSKRQNFLCTTALAAVLDRPSAAGGNLQILYPSL